MAATLTGCGSTLVATAKPFCEAVRDVRISKNDVLTEGTAKQLRANAEGRKAVCGDDKVPAPAEPPKQVASVEAAKGQGR